MSDPATIRPDGARILVTRSGTASSPPGLADRTELGGSSPVHAEITGAFVATDIAATMSAPGTDDGSAQVALVASPDVAAGLRAKGWAGPVVVEVILDERAQERLESLRRADELVGVVVPPCPPAAGGVADSRPTHDASAGSDPLLTAAATPDEAEAGRARGRTIGLLTAAVRSGVATIRTEDPVMARRVRAVVAALTELDPGAARMDR